VFINDASVNLGGGHGNAFKALGSVNFGDTYDTKFAAAFGDLYPQSQLLLGVQSGFGNKEGITKSGNTISYQDNPVAAYNTLFGNIDTSGASTGNTGVDISRGKSILDVQKAEIEALRSVLGSFEQARLDEHLASLERIESRLEASANPGSVTSCSIAGGIVDGFEYEENNRDNFKREAELQIDIAIAALNCKLTNNVSIALSNEACENFDNSLNWQDIYHQSIHAGSTEDFIEFRAYMSEITAYLIESLRNTDNGVGGNMLDRTLVLQVTDMADGVAHTTDGAPMFIAGGGSSINSGIVTSMGANTNHNGMFDTVTDLFGLDIPYIGGGPIPGVIA